MNARGTKGWDSEVLDRKLKKYGFGLLLVEGKEVSEHLRPRDNELDAKKVEEVLPMLNDKSRVKAVER